MIIPMKYTHFGYKFLDVVSKVPFQYHSGIDLNFGKPNEDEGMEIKACAKGIVQFAKDTGKGWGNLIVVYHPAFGIWSRYAHLKEIKVVVGDKVEEGHLIGFCGHTGGNWNAHLHFDIILKELKSWTKYTSWMKKEEVLQYYTDPLPYIAKINSEHHISDWKLEAEKWAIDNKISIGGNPDAPASRVEVWNMLKNFYNLTK